MNHVEASQYIHKQQTAVVADGHAFASLGDYVYESDHNRSNAISVMREFTPNPYDHPLALPQHMDYSPVPNYYWHLASQSRLVHLEEIKRIKQYYTNAYHRIFDREDLHMCLPFMFRFSLAGYRVRFDLESLVKDVKYGIQLALLSLPVYIHHIDLNSNEIVVTNPSVLYLKDQGYVKDYHVHIDAGDILGKRRYNIKQRLNAGKGIEQMKAYLDVHEFDNPNDFALPAMHSR